MIPPNRHRLVIVALALSLMANVFGAGYIAYRASRKGGLRFVMERLDLCDVPAPAAPFQVEERDEFRKLPDTPGEVVFAGDSLIAAGPWSELFSTIKRRGIGGETTAGLLGRIDEIASARPSKVFLLIGTNDLAADVPIAQSARNYRAIVEKLRAASPATRIYVIGVLPVNQAAPQGPAQDNATVRELNARLRELVAETPNAEFVDLSEVLADRDGSLRLDLTPDGLHLTLDAYLLIGEKLRDKVLGGVPSQARASTP